MDEREEKMVEQILRRLFLVAYSYACAKLRVAAGRKRSVTGREVHHNHHCISEYSFSTAAVALLSRCPVVLEGVACGVAGPCSRAGW